MCFISLSLMVENSVSKCADVFSVMIVSGSEPIFDNSSREGLVFWNSIPISRKANSNRFIILI